MIFTGYTLFEILAGGGGCVTIAVTKLHASLVVKINTLFLKLKINYNLF